MIESLLPKLPPVRVSKPVCTVLHQTGQTDLDALISYYQKGPIAPHYMIETTGSVRRFVPEDHIAYHAKMDPHEARLYQRGYEEWSCWIWQDDQPVHKGMEQERYRMWRDQWREHGYQSPLALVTGDHPNSVSIGIEFQRPLYPTKQFLTPEQYATAGRLIPEIAKRWNFPCERARVLHHYDVSPLRRSTSAGSYDLPPSFSYNALWDAMRTGGRLNADG